MHPLAITLLISLYLIQFYNSLRKLSKDSFKDIFYTANLEEFDLDKIKIINELDKRYKVDIIDADKIIVERKFSAFDFGYAFLVTISSAKVELSFYNRNLMKISSKVRKQDIIHILKMNRVIG